jgi:glutamate synthase domain-containing protein 1/glutamate synthase domain-containing protein 3
VRERGFRDAREDLARLLVASEGRLAPPSEPLAARLRSENAAEGGCGVIGTASSVQTPGRALLAALTQMRNRGNGKGGGVAAVGLDPSFFGVAPQVMREDYLLAVAYLDATARSEVEARFVEPVFDVHSTFDMPALADPSELALDVRPPDVVCYFVRVRPDALKRFMRENGLGRSQAAVAAAEDEVVFQNTYALNTAFYASTGDKRAFVLSHAKDLLVTKIVGYGDDVVRWYRMEELRAHVWIGHHRYPTKGTVWHPGGAHPFIGMNEALVHNGDFANYASMCTYLAGANRHPLYLTDTEAAVLVFDLLHRVYGYPLEYVIEAMAPTTERDFALLPQEKKDVYRMLQAVHMHGSPDGPWFFLIAQSEMLPKHAERAYRLIGITDTSMLRPQVFALQDGEVQIGFASSEKQGIDAALASLSREDPRFWSRADRYWNARGGSHTDGGAFVFTIQPDSERHGDGDGDGAGGRVAVCTDKFGRVIEADATKVAPVGPALSVKRAVGAEALAAKRELDAASLFEQVRDLIPSLGYGDVSTFLDQLAASATEDPTRDRAIETLTLLVDRRYPTGTLKRSALLSLYDSCLTRVVEQIERKPSLRWVWITRGQAPLRVPDDVTTMVMDASGYDVEGDGSLSRGIVELYETGFRRFMIVNTAGHRFIGCGLVARSGGTRIDVFGSSGDYLASGIDGCEIVVHGNAQDQLAQIMKDGTLVIHGDVGQTFGYGAKGGSIFVLGNAAGRPLINGVGRPRVVINGTCLDYLAESFMAGDPLDGGGFVVLNGVAYDEDGELHDLAEPYPGGNLFSLASGGAIYVRDPNRVVGEDQLNAAEFAELGDEDWRIVEDVLRRNETIFGITVDRLLTVDGERREPRDVYRKIRPSAHGALTPEEAWVRPEGA